MKTPVPLIIPEGLTPQAQEAYLRLHSQAYNLRHKTGTTYLYLSSTQLHALAIPTEAYDLYLEQLRESAQNPDDPIEQMMIEQIALAHHNIGRLHVKAANTANPDQAQIVSSAVVHLLAEFRRLTLALKKYREPTVPNNFTVVKQQNLAQSQQVAFVDQADGATAGAPSHSSDTKVGSNAIDYDERPEIIPKSTTRSRRQTESVAAKRVNA